MHTRYLYAQSTAQGHISASTMHRYATYDKSNSVSLFGTHFSLFMIGEVKCQTSAKQPNAFFGGGGGVGGFFFFFTMVCDRYVCMLGVLRPVNRAGSYQCETTIKCFLFLLFFTVVCDSMLAGSVFYCLVNRAGCKYQCETTK